MSVTLGTEFIGDSVEGSFGGMVVVEASGSVKVRWGSGDPAAN